MRKLSDRLREEAKEDPRDLSSRTDARREQRESEDALTELATRLTELGKKHFARLSLPEYLAIAVVEARRITSPPALERQLRVVRRVLRGLDIAPILAALDELEHPRESHDVHRRALQWAQRLLVEGEAGLQQFLESFPHADRTRVRTLMRAKVTKPDAPAPKALVRALEEEMVAVQAD